MRLKCWGVPFVVAVLLSNPALSVTATDSGLVEALGQPKGRMKLAETLHDFGVLKRGSKVTHEFQFVNEGRGPLVIHGVHAGCGCTAAETETGRVYEPGDRGAIRVTLDSTNFRGQMNKSVTVMTNEALLPAKTLSVRALVEEEVSAEPPVVDFGNVVGREDAVKTVVVKPIAKGLNLEIQRLRYNEKALKVGYVKEGSDWVMTVELASDVAPGFFSDTIYVANNSQALPELPILVRANVAGNITFSPNYVEFGSIPARDKAVRTVKFTGIEAFDVKGARAELNVNGSRVERIGEFVKIGQAISSDERRRDIAVELVNGEGLSGSVHGKLFFQTSDPKQTEVTVDFYAFFQEE